MSFKTYVTAAVAATLALSSLSTFAQTYDKRGKVIIIQQQPDDYRDGRRDQRQDYRQDYRHDNRRNDRVQIRGERRDDGRDRWREERADRANHYYYYGARGPEFVRGHYLPNDLRVRQYVVTDYRQHRLPAPPYGQHWVQVGGDYVLVAIATGIIASIILNH